MKTILIELYGFEYTPFALSAGFVVILLSGLLMAFSNFTSAKADAPAVNVEWSR
jgi:hypothetical protein